VNPEHIKKKSGENMPGRSRNSQGFARPTIAETGALDFAPIGR
jgi:hypothetical protein